ncbi:DUF3298 domain-containing protein [Paenibacillus sp. MBLB4367]|uniref:DUF3298 and DUF4163 domain-containing protein n=1 Tax=Paenibacillus sp. MBLB4367 TaxID=3384767 RepID=UPI0039083979
MTEPYHLPVQVRTMHIKRPKVDIQYPNVVMPQQPGIQQHINSRIDREVQQLIRLQGYYEHPAQTEMTGLYEIKTNERGIFSVSLSNYAYTEKMAHGLTLLKSLTFDIRTGKAYALNELFKPGSDYVGRISAQIQEQIKARNIPVLQPFTKIRPDQDFYIADRSLVVYFQLYEITPYYYGFPFFPISAYSLQDMIPDNSPLGYMLVNM